MSDGVTNHEVPDPDAESVRLARQGDYEAFERLVARHERSIYTLAMRIVRNPEDAEDVVQQTFLSVLEHLDGFAGQSQFRTWLVRIATNHALKTLRKRRGLPIAATGAGGEDDDTRLPHPEFIAPWRDDPVELAGRRETQELLDAALDQLDEKYRLVFLLRDVEGLSTEETARELGITVANVKVRLLRARLMLREKLTRTLGDTQRRVIARHDHED
ncbi:MAG TPA: sigma-70 family RNA polymerase sigma factor [Phycisphaerae bacterium]|nr:sigma-70 family RNA polymerase sigma factor [Phycisphaerae bacterium]